jgi:hypothetical protein
LGERGTGYWLFLQGKNMRGGGKKEKNVKEKVIKMKNKRKIEVKKQKKPNLRRKMPKVKAKKGA